MKFGMVDDQQYYGVTSEEEIEDYVKVGYFTTEYVNKVLNMVKDMNPYKEGFELGYVKREDRAILVLKFEGFKGAFVLADRREQ